MNPEQTIYVNDAIVIHDLLQNVEILLAACKMDLAHCGHSYAGAVALVSTMQKLSDIHGSLKKCAKMLPDEAKANIDLLLAGML